MHCVCVMHSSPLSFLFNARVSICQHICNTCTYVHAALSQRGCFRCVVFFSFSFTPRVGSCMKHAGRPDGPQTHRALLATTVAGVGSSPPSPPFSLSPPGWPEVVRPRLGRRREAADQTASCLTAGDEETVSRISEQSIRSPLQSHVSGSPSARCHQRWLNSDDDCEVMEQHTLLL